MTSNSWFFKGRSRAWSTVDVEEPIALLSILIILVEEKQYRRPKNERKSGVTGNLKSRGKLITNQDVLKKTDEGFKIPNQIEWPHWFLVITRKHALIIAMW